MTGMARPITNMGTQRNGADSSPHNDDAEQFQPWPLPAGMSESVFTEGTHFRACDLAEPIKTAADPQAHQHAVAQFCSGNQQVLVEAQEQAEQIIAEARQQAACLQQEAADQLEILLLRRAGEEAEAVREEQTAHFKQATETLIEQFRRQAGTALAELSDRLAELAAGITAKIIHRHIAADDRIVLDVVAEAMKQLPDVKRLRVVINPSDKEAITAHQQELLREVSGLDGLEIVTDVDIERGGCLLDSDRGEVDARLSSQLELIWKRVSAGDVLQKSA